MTEEQKRRLTEKLLKECWHEPQWTDHRGTICLKCNADISNFFPDYHRTFLTWPDLGACMEALVREGLWEDFEHYAHQKFRCYVTDSQFHFPFDVNFITWLFRPVNEVGKAGKAHFCALKADFLEAKDGQK